MTDIYETLQEMRWAADCRAAHRMRNGAGGSFASCLADAYFAAATTKTACCPLSATFSTASQHPRRTKP